MDCPDQPTVIASLPFGSGRKERASGRATRTKPTKPNRPNVIGIIEIHRDRPVQTQRSYPTYFQSLIVILPPIFDKSVQKRRSPFPFATLTVADWRWRRPYGQSRNVIENTVRTAIVIPKPPQVAMATNTGLPATNPNAALTCGFESVSLAGGVPDAKNHREAEHGFAGELVLQPFGPVDTPYLPVL